MSSIIKKFFIGMCFYVFPIATAFGLQADFFSDIQVSSPHIGERLAITYMRINSFGGKNARYSCDTQNIKNWLNDDYMTCQATDMSGKTQQIEFQFDDLSESMDSEIHTSTAAAMCKIFGGGTGLQRTTCRDLGMVGCAALDKNLRIAFGYKAKYHTNNSGNGYCITDFDKRGENYNPKNTLVYQDKNIKIDNFKFEKLQLRYIDDLKFLLERYVTNEISNHIPNAKISTFRCTDGFKTWNRGIMNNDDLISCFVTFDGQQSSQEIEFVFDDINEAIDLTARGGTDGLRCLAGNGGKYLGGQCHGITQQQCEQLNRVSAGGAVWDTTLETCTLKDGVAASDLDRAAKIAKIVGTGAAVVAITVATGGTATSIIISVTATSLGAAAQVQKNIITDQCNEQIAYGQQVKRNVSKCAKQYPDNDIDDIEQCFGEYLQKFINTAGLCIHENAADSSNC